MTKKDDSAGPMLGWSVGTGIDGKSISELLELPCLYSFKAIGDATNTYVADLCSAIESRLGRPLLPEEIDSKKSSAEKYVSVTFSLHMETIEDIHAIYALLKAHPSTRFLL